MNFKVLIFVVLCLNGACTFHTASLNLKEHGLYSNESSPGNRQFEDIGPVSGSYSTWIWKPCKVVVIEAVKEMLEEARAKGANVVYRVRFEKNDIPVIEAGCKKSWGWLVLGIPYPASAFVSGMAAKVAEKGASTFGDDQLYLREDEDLSVLAESIVTQTIE